jgi:AraC-like DNA-binding protein
MNIAEYTFNTLCHENERMYIFQFVKGRKLTRIYHSHDFYEIVCFLRGRGTQIVNEEEVVSEGKTVMILYPGDRHCFVDQSDDIEIVSLSVRREEFELLLKTYGAPLEKHPVSFDFHRVSKIYDIYRENRMICEIDCKLLLSTLLHAYAHTKDSLGHADMLTVLLPAAEEMKKIENLRKGISAFVALSNYSQSHLARLVKKHFGMGLNQYVNELRLLKAYDDLIWTNDSAETISENLGFSSYSHFYRIFKARFSLSPSALRNGNKKY